VGDAEVDHLHGLEATQYMHSGHRVIVNLYEQFRRERSSIFRSCIAVSQTRAWCAGTGPARTSLRQERARTKSRAGTVPVGLVDRRGGRDGTG